MSFQNTVLYKQLKLLELQPMHYQTKQGDDIQGPEIDIKYVHSI